MASNNIIQLVPAKLGMLKSKLFPLQQMELSKGVSLQEREKERERKRERKREKERERFASSEAKNHSHRKNGKCINRRENGRRVDHFTLTNKQKYIAL